MTGAEPVTDRRGGDSRARRNAAEMNRQSLKRQTPPTCHCEGASCPWQSREGTCSPYRPPSKWHAPIASVAALTAQPLAALPPYGCGVPFTGSERLACWQSLRHAFCGVRPSSLSLRGGQRPTWQSRSTRPDRGEAVGENVTAFPRLHPKGTSSRFALRAPRRFAPRNDTSGWCCGAPALSYG